MIDVLFEQRVIQNTGLAAEAIWQAVHEAYETKGRTEGGIVSKIVKEELK